MTEVPKYIERIKIHAIRQGLINSAKAEFNKAIQFLQKANTENRTERRNALSVFGSCAKRGEEIYEELDKFDIEYKEILKEKIT